MPGWRVALASLACWHGELGGDQASRRQRRAQLQAKEHCLASLLDPRQCLANALPLWHCRATLEQVSRAPAPRHQTSGIQRTVRFESHQGYPRHCHCPHLHHRSLRGRWAHWHGRRGRCHWGKCVRRHAVEIVAARPSPWRVLSPSQPHPPAKGQPSRLLAPAPMPELLVPSVLPRQRTVLVTLDCRPSHGVSGSSQFQRRCYQTAKRWRRVTLGSAVMGPSVARADDVQVTSPKRAMRCGRVGWYRLSGDDHRQREALARQQPTPQPGQLRSPLQRLSRLPAPAVQLLVPVLRMRLAVLPDHATLGEVPRPVL